MLFFLIFNSKNSEKISVYYNDFWRSCDTEDRSNDAEITRLKYIQIKKLLL